MGDPLFDTSNSQGKLLATLLAAIAEFERELIRERTGEGRKRAMAAGVKFGRKRKLCNIDGCLVRLGDEPSDLMQFDDNHLSVAGSKFFVRSIAKQILD